MAKKVKLEILGISYSQSQSGAYTLILGEKKSPKRLPIVIGGFEAQAIAIELEKMKPKRPLTHDLLKTVTQSFEIELIEVVIHEFKEGVFYSNLIFQDKEKKEKIIDARASDAVALAVRYHCPIFAEKKVIDDAGVELEIRKMGEEKPKEESEIESEIEDKIKEINENDLKDYTLDELNTMMNLAIKEEDFEKASIIRDEINSRN